MLSRVQPVCVLGAAGWHPGRQRQCRTAALSATASEMLQGARPSSTPASVRRSPRRRAARSPSATARRDRRSSPPPPQELFGAEVTPAPSPRRRPADIETSIRPQPATPDSAARISAAAPELTDVGANAPRVGWMDGDSKLVQLARGAEARLAGYPAPPSLPPRSDLNAWHHDPDACSDEAAQSSLRRGVVLDSVHTASAIASAKLTRRAIDLAHTALRAGDFKQAATALSQSHVHTTDSAHAQDAVHTHALDTPQQSQLVALSEQQTQQTRQGDTVSRTRSPRRLRTVYVDVEDRHRGRISCGPSSSYGAADSGAEYRIPLVE